MVNCQNCRQNCQLGKIVVEVAWSQPISFRVFNVWFDQFWTKIGILGKIQNASLKKFLNWWILEFVDIDWVCKKGAKPIHQPIDGLESCQPVCTFAMAKSFLSWNSIRIIYFLSWEGFIRPKTDMVICFKSLRLATRCTYRLLLPSFSPSLSFLVGCRCSISFTTLFLKYHHQEITMFTTLTPTFFDSFLTISTTIGYKSISSN